MCGRYYRRSDKQKIAEHFRVSNDYTGLVLPESDYNIAPSTGQLIIRADPEQTEAREMTTMKWGLIPAAAPDPAAFKTYTTTNARAETIMQKGIWKYSFQHHRCLITLDGCYEWLQHPEPVYVPTEVEQGLFGAIEVENKRRSPKPKPAPKPAFRFFLKSEQPYALAGLFSQWRDTQGLGRPPLDTFSVITTEANELMAPVHDRMPVILHPRDYDRWLYEDKPEHPPLDLLRPYTGHDLIKAPASPQVGNVRNNGPEMLNSA